VLHATGDRNRFAQQLFTPLPGRYDLLAEVLSFGQNGRWRRAMVDRIAGDGPARVLDVATGTAGVALQVAARTGAQVVGVDLTMGMLRQGQRRVAASRDSGRIHLVAGRGEQLPFPDASFEALTFTYLLRYVDDPAATLRELARVVRPGGRVASLEFGVPPLAPARAAWRFYTAVGLPALGRLASPEWARVGRFLGPSIRGYYGAHPLESIVRDWGAAGLDDVRVRHMSFGGGIVMSATRRA
jgi:demethylmenaquinone methyltransferase / 2-methoxy-6-polyprenyl-1,4-benzoquinol methylase